MVIDDGLERELRAAADDIGAFASAGSVNRKRSELFARAADAVLRLDQINETIYAAGAPLGSPEYFRVRELATKHLHGQ